MSIGSGTYCDSPPSVVAEQSGDCGRVADHWEKTNFLVISRAPSDANAPPGRRYGREGGTQRNWCQPVAVVPSIRASNLGFCDGISSNLLRASGSRRASTQSACLDVRLFSLFVRVSAHLIGIHEVHQLGYRFPTHPSAACCPPASRAQWSLMNCSTSAADTVPAGTGRSLTIEAASVAGRSVRHIRVSNSARSRSRRSLGSSPDVTATRNSCKRPAIAFTRGSRGPPLPNHRGSRACRGTDHGETLVHSHHRRRRCPDQTACTASLTAEGLARPCS